MLDPTTLYQLDPDQPTLDEPVLLSTVPGFVDAGAAGRILTRHLLDTLAHRRLAVFDVDQIVDHRSHRPLMTFVEDHWDDYRPHELAVHLVDDRAGTPFLLLAGPEPDYHWERFVAAVGQLIERYGVRLTVGTNAIPMAVPHTRPTGITAHATDKELVAGYEPWIQTVQVPGSVGALLEYRLGQANRRAVGFAAHVPHYVAQAEYPGASIALLEAIERVSGLDLGTLELTAAADRTRVSIDEQVAKSDEVGGVVRALEEQFDAYAGAADRSRLLAMDGPLPSADELGAEFERFLADQQRRED